MMLHTKYQGSRPCGFRQEDLFMFALCKTFDPRAIFLPQGYNLNKLGRGPLGDATYKISRFLALWFQKRRFFHICPIYAYVKHVTPSAGPFLAPGVLFEQTW